MEYIFSAIFGQVFARYGVIAALVSLAMFAVLVLTAYYLKGRIDTTRTAVANEAAAAACRAANEAAVSSAREAELRQARAVHEQFMQGLVAQFQASHEKLTAALVGIERNCTLHCAEMLDLKTSLSRHAEDSAKGRGIIHARLNIIQMQLAGVKNLPSEEPMP